MGKNNKIMKYKDHLDEIQEVKYICSVVKI